MQGDLRWVAGFLEGEGSFYYRSQNGFRVVAPQKQRWPLDQLVDLVGGKVYIRGDNGMHYWILCGPWAVNLARSVRPFMSPRRQEQIDLALRKWGAAGTRPGNRQRCPQGHILEAARSQRVCRTCIRAAARQRVAI